MVAVHLHLHLQITHSFFFDNIVSPKKKLSISAKKKDILPQRSSILPLKLSKTLLARSAVAVFGLGFIDAGYSGDWSRIGVISMEIEQVLKVAAFLVIPFCILLIISISPQDNP